MRPLVCSIIFLSNLATITLLAQSREQEPLKPVDEARIADTKKVLLGKMLFFERRLSKSSFISCNSCHNVATAGVDNLPTGISNNWLRPPLNTPTVMNSKYNLAFNWNGSAKDYVEQVATHLADPNIMDSQGDTAVNKLLTLPKYVELFGQVFGTKEINLARVGAALAGFLETLLTPGSRFDLWLNGDNRALTSEEKRGYELFKQKGCVSCHRGPAVGSDMFQKFGLVRAYDKDKKNLGRFEVTRQAQDKYVFKVPTLRNIALTAPYFHDGSVWTLTEAVDVMAWHQLGIKLRRDENRAIVSFLKSLTGKQPRIEVPELPPYRAKTPKPSL